MSAVGETAGAFPETNQGDLLSALAEDPRAGGHHKEAELIQAAPDSQAQHHGTREKKESEFPQQHLHSWHTASCWRYAFSQRSSTAPVSSPTPSHFRSREAMSATYSASERRPPSLASWR